MNDAVPLELLRASYEAFAERRLRRSGASHSLRTRNGYERLRAKYQPQQRLLQDAQDPETAKENDAIQHPTDGDTAAENDSEASALLQLVGVFFDARGKRLVLETLWPLAHHGGGSGSNTRAVPEWQDLDEHKYFAFMLKTLLWLFPGLPAFEAQELTEWDWSKDCEFDAFGSSGLSFEGFMVSMLDLALACTDNSVDKCVDFLTQLAKRLEASLPIFRMPTTTMLPSPADDDSKQVVNPYDQIAWRTIPLERLFPCPVRVRPQFLELKAKLSVAPVILMVLAENQRPLELQLSTSAKLLVRERDHRSSVRRNTMDANARSHFIEVEKQFLWTFRSFPARPTLVLVPSGLVSKRTLTLYACARLLESHEHSLEQSQVAESEGDPILTMFTAVQEPFPLLFGASDSLCGRIDRQSSRLFTVDHRGRDAKSFKIVFKTSLIHNTSSAGGAGVSAIVTSLANVDSTSTARCKSELVGGANQSSPTTPHSFIFVVRLTSGMLASGPERRRASTLGAGKGSSNSTDASVPAQWFTTLTGANENKTIFIDTSTETEEDLSDDDSMAGMYYVYVFTLHGFYFEAVCEDSDEDPKPSSVDEDETNSPFSMLTNPEPPKPCLDDASPALEGDELRLGLDGGGASATRSGVSVTTSAALLRQLLHLRKQRQLRTSAQPPPECIGGSKITSMKMLTSAAGLRAKFLKARAEERRTRFLQHEEQFRSKVVAKLLKAESKKKALRGGVIEPEAPSQPTSSPSSAIPADLEAKATLIVNFFKEMAVYQPTQRELDEEAIAPVDQDDKLLENFADLFHDDHALQNMLDQEKWMTTEEKSTRRQSILDERKKSRHQSLMTLNRQQIPEIHSDATETDDAQDSKRKKSAATRASEDYYSTAMLINQLMREVAEEEDERSVAADNNKQESEERERVKQLAASWEFAHRNVDVSSSEPSSPGENQHEAIDMGLRDLEDARRGDWYSSHYVHELANNERLRQQQSTLRPTFVPTLQPFDHREELPWQPIWEVEVGAEESRDARGFSPPKIRPKTASATVFSPRPPPSSVRSDRSPAVQAATLARTRTRRIRSAHLKPASRAEQKLDDDRVDSLLQRDQERREMVTHVPQVFLRDPYGVIVGESELFSSSTAVVSECQVPERGSREPQTREGVQCAKSDGSPLVASETHMLQGKPKRKKKKKLTSEEKRFGGRVRELLSISPLLQSFAPTASR